MVPMVLYQPQDNNVCLGRVDCLVIVLSLWSVDTQYSTYSINTVSSALLWQCWSRGKRTVRSFVPCLSLSRSLLYIQTLHEKEDPCCRFFLLCAFLLFLVAYTAAADRHGAARFGRTDTLGAFALYGHRSLCNNSSWVLVHFFLRRKHHDRKFIHRVPKRHTFQLGALTQSLPPFFKKSFSIKQKRQKNNNNLKRKEREKTLAVRSFLSFSAVYLN